MPKVLSGIALLLNCLASCSKDPAATAEPPRAQAQPVSDDQAGSAAADRPGAAAQPVPAGENEAEAAPEGKSSVAESPADIQEENFALKLKPVGTFSGGKPGQVAIELLAKAPFKVNDEYPYKFKVKSAPGLEVPEVITRENVTLEEKRAVMTISLTPESTGQKRLQGQFLFSICTDDKCLIEKRDLGLTLNVN